MSQDKPRVSIGLAVYNGAQYLEQAIDSILAQTYTDFELIISDNASTDRTAEICAAYGAKDPRIRYSRNLTNIGGANNENLTFTLAQGEYFRWAAHDDVCAPELFEKCVAKLDQDPSVVLCCTQVIEMDQDGTFLQITGHEVAQSRKSYQRFRELSFRKNQLHNCEATYGLIRSEVLRKTRLQQNYSDSDRTLLCELSLYGRFHEIAEPLFYKRYHPKNQHLDLRARMAWFDRSLKGKITFPNWLQFFDLFVTINRTNISWYEKMRCYLIMGHWFVAHSRSLVKDLVVALSMVTHIGKWRRHHDGLFNWE